MNRIAHSTFQIGESPIEQELVRAVERSELRRQPFAHIYMERAFRSEDYFELLVTMPAERFYHPLRHQDATRVDGSSTRLRMYLYPELLWRLPRNQRRAWAPVARALCSRHLENAFRRKFCSELEDRFGKPVGAIGLYPVPILLRDRPGYRIGIHSDVLSKAITVQFYLPADNAQRHIGTIFHEGRDSEMADRTTQMPFLPATGYAFPVCATKSWHSAAMTTDADGERVSMMVTYYVADEPWTWLKFRLRRIGLFLGIHPKG
jgi:hypothetical protein